MSSLEEDFTYGVTVAQTNLKIRLGQYFAVFLLRSRPQSLLEISVFENYHVLALFRS